MAYAGLLSASLVGVVLNKVFCGGVKFFLSHLFFSMLVWKILSTFENNYLAKDRKNFQRFPDKITRKHIAVAFHKSYT